MTEKPKSEVPPLSDEEKAVLLAIPRGGSEAVSIRVEGVSPQKRSRILTTLEKRGLVEKTPNPWGPETPWWWARVAAAPMGWEPTMTVEAGMIFDRYELSGRPMTFVELLGRTNEYGCEEVMLRAGTHNSRITWLSRYALEDIDYWIRRIRGPVTEYSRRFSCPVHGECTEEMVTTKKTCSLCETGLLRH
jgi:hypothetical protein